MIEAFRKARKQIDCVLVLLGNNASDAPEGEVILETIKASVVDGIISANNTTSPQLRLDKS